MPMKDFFDFGDPNLTEERQALLLRLNTLVGQMDDGKLDQLLKLGDVLNDH
jgi:hypothetical protein